MGVRAICRQEEDEGEYGVLKRMGVYRCQSLCMLQPTASFSLTTETQSTKKWLTLDFGL